MTCTPAWPQMLQLLELVMKIMSNLEVVLKNTTGKELYLPAVIFPRVSVVS